jgi:hypothetical protein
MDAPESLKLVFSEVLGRRIRMEPPPTLGRSTIHFVRRALMTGDLPAAGDLIKYMGLEHTTVLRIYELWNRELVHYLEDRCSLGLEDIWKDTLVAWIKVSTGAGNGDLHFATDGRKAALRLRVSPFIVFRVVQNPRSIRFDFGQHRAFRRMLSALSSKDAEMTLKILDGYIWRARLAHDVASDWTWALLTRIAVRLGEKSLENAFRRSLGSWFLKRYEKLASMSVEEYLALTVEGMRGHFTGPGRLGDVTVSDEGDRYVLSFDPCGSGGRMRRGDSLVNSPPRSDPPYKFGFTEKAWPWSWQKRGVCYYCAHCSMVNEILAIELAGYPMRITEYPEEATNPCKWIVYKDAKDIPATAFARVGKYRSAG